jgi:hypothetical protein
MKNCQYDKMTQKLQIVEFAEVYPWIGRDENKHCV